jgi:homocysteine S-methyltransferase
MNLIASILDRQPAIVMEGALATELERRGADLRDPLWSAKILLEQPDLIRAVHLDYFRAGADCATTASYQATVPGFAARGIPQADALALIRRSVELARQARAIHWAEAQPAARTHFIAGSVGPYGAYLADGSEYSGDYGLDEGALSAFHRPRLAALVESGVDIIACETIPSLLEARALAALLSEFPGVPAWITFSARDGVHTSRGEPVRDCAAYLDSFSQVAAVGINCTPPHFIPSLIREMSAATRKPIVVYPNSGELWDAQRKCWYGETSHGDFAAGAREWYAAGARLIGGCCRTTPEHVRAAGEVLRAPAAG